MISSQRLVNNQLEGVFTDRHVFFMRLSVGETVNESGKPQEESFCKIIQSDAEGPGPVKRPATWSAANVPRQPMKAVIRP
jgi:hypothetical protein